VAEYEVTEPGFHPIPDGVRLGDFVPGGGLSVSGAKKLLPPSCPAIYAYERDHPKPRTKSMELGTVIHTLVLGTGQPLEVIDARDWRSQKAQDQRDKAIANGALPVLAEDMDKASEIHAAVKSHPLAGALFDGGDAEQAMFWRCPEFGIWKYGRLDYLRWIRHGPAIVDLKSCQSAADDEIARAVAKYGYYMQDPFYREGVEQITGAYPDFFFVFVQTQQPYLVNVVRLRDRDVELGRQRCRLAAEIYRDCTASGTWPGYGDDIREIALPRWQERAIESEIDLVYGY